MVGQIKEAKRSIELAKFYATKENDTSFSSDNIDLIIKRIR